MKNKIREWIEQYLSGAYKRRIILMGFDAACFAMVTVLYFFVSRRAANSMPVEDASVFLFNACVHLVVLTTARLMIGAYSNVWRYANTKAYFELILADAAAGLITLILIRILQTVMPGVYYGLWQALVVGSVTALAVLLSRFGYCLLYKSLSRKDGMKQKTPAVIVGAGRLGALLSDELRDNPASAHDPMFFVDVDSSKIGNTVSGLKVYDEEDAENLIRQLGIRDVLVAISGQDGIQLAALYRRYTDLGCRVRIYDTLAGGRSHDGQRRMIRDFSIEDLLFRKPIVINNDKTAAFYRGRTVLITGGGGSIGSELCRRIAACGPKQLIIFDVYENNAYEIQQELLRRYGEDLDLVVEIGSVRDTERLDQLFAAYRPEIVFHAAAHKHVPLMEHCGAEAIKNNVIGTYNTANAAEQYGAERFVLISTDKAVNPTNIMGASKRLCEMLIQCRTDSETSFAAVRFGNVLGSNGSVIPLFRRQIEQGGPITVTDKRIIRYFMTIPEASQLVIQAGVMAKAGELFVLDMGKPVRIYELAETMIRLSGYVPGKDIQIEEIGLRPGEKLYEELLMKAESLSKTDNDLIFVEKDTPMTRQQMEEILDRLQAAMRDPAMLKKQLRTFVPTYREADEVNSDAEQAAEMRQAHEEHAEAEG